MSDLASMGKEGADNIHLTDVRVETGTEIPKPGGLKAQTCRVRGKRDGLEFTALLVLFTTEGGQYLLTTIDTSEAVNAQDASLTAIADSVRMAGK